MSTLVPDPSEHADWQGVPAADLVDHIVQRFHGRHRVQLPELIRLSRTVERVHALDPQCPVGLTDTLEGLQQALESHMLKEEQVLFPMLVQGMGARARGPVAVMRIEHTEQHQAMADIQRMTGNFVTPDRVCNTWLALYGGLKSFLEDLAQHIHLEDEVLFLHASNAVEGAHDGRV